MLKTKDVSGILRWGRSRGVWRHGDVLAGLAGRAPRAGWGGAAGWGAAGGAARRAERRRPAGAARRAEIMGR
jgi:hypothetical protein